MQEIDYVEVETQSLDDLARGLEDDARGMRVAVNEMRADILGLREVWKGVDHDSFEDEVLENGDHLSRSLDALDRAVEALVKTARYYHDLEQRLDEELPNL